MDYFSCFSPTVKFLWGFSHPLNFVFFYLPVLSENTLHGWRFRLTFCWCCVSLSLSDSLIKRACSLDIKAREDKRMTKMKQNKKRRKREEKPTLWGRPLKGRSVYLPRDHLLRQSGAVRLPGKMAGDISHVWSWEVEWDKKQVKLHCCGKSLLIITINKMK